MIENLLRFVPVPKREDVEVSQDDMKEFLNSLLSGVPYRKEYKVDKILISFVAPNINVFDENNLDITTLFVASLDQITVGNQKLIPSLLNKPLNERKSIVHNVLFENPSPLSYIVIQKFFSFFYLFQKLLQAALASDFFGTGSTG